MVIYNSFDERLEIHENDDATKRKINSSLTGLCYELSMSKLV